MDPAEWRGFAFREGAGCMECGGTGYRGRTAIHELLDLTDPIREMILDKKPTSEIRKLAQKEGMSFLRESALERVRRGVTTLKEINKVTFIEASRLTGFAMMMFGRGSTERRPNDAMVFLNEQEYEVLRGESQMAAFSHDLTDCGRSLTKGARA